MGTLALDIETGSPFEEPPGRTNDTAFFEWLSIAVAYRDSPDDEPTVEVFFREADWGEEGTAALFDRLIEWCDARDVDRVLTYNGEWFDLKHLANWAQALDESGVRPGTDDDLERICSVHIDLAVAATDRHEDKLLDGQPVLPAWKAYQLEGIDNDRIWYDDYAFNDDYFQGLGIDDSFVKGQHVGQALASAYVDGVVAGLESTSTHQALRRLLYDYSVSDVADLFALYDALGGKELDVEYGHPLGEGRR